MSQTWENAQQRGVVKLGQTTVHMLGNAYQQAGYQAQATFATGVKR